MKRIKKIISFAVAMVMSINIGLFANAAQPNDFGDEGGVTVNSVYDNAVTASLSISNKKATCTGKVTGIPGKTTKINIKVYLDRKVSAGWLQVDYVEKTVNGSSTSLSFTRFDLMSATYRTRVEAKLYEGSTYIRKDKNSSSVSC